MERKGRPHEFIEGKSFMLKAATPPNHAEERKLAGLRFFLLWEMAQYVGLRPLCGTSPIFNIFVTS